MRSWILAGYCDGCYDSYCDRCYDSYCDGCYEKAPSCDDCGWHINPDRAADHLRQAHHD